MARGASIAGLRGTVGEQRRVLERLVASWRRAGAGVAGDGPADPVFLVRAYTDARDREVAGLLAALFAYGRVELFCRAVDAVLRELGPSPRSALESGRHQSPGFAAGFRYRFQNREDLRAILTAAAETIRRWGSLGAALEAMLPPAGPGPEALDAALGRWVRELRRQIGPRQTRGLLHLLADPVSGGAGKRWRLYLRWMIRPDDGVDCGAWSGRFSPADLTLPLDTHWIRMAPRLGLARRRTPGLRMAREITDGLRRIAPKDPLRYDLPVCQIGIRGGCPPGLSPAHCRSCPLRAICPTAAQVAGGAARS